MRSKTIYALLIRYNLYVDCMPTDDITPLTVETINRIIGFALNSRLLKEKLMDTTQYINEINIQYARSMNKIIFDHQACCAQLPKGTVMVPLTHEDFMEHPDDKFCIKAAGQINIASYDFFNQFSEFSFRTLLTKQEVVSATVKVRVECQKVLKMQLFNTHFAKSMKVDEFEQSQLQTGDQVRRVICFITK